MLKRSFLLLFLAMSMAGSVFAFKEEATNNSAVVQNIGVLRGALPQNNNDKQDFTVKWGIASSAAGRKFESFLVELTVVRADGSTKSDSKQVNGAAREVVIKLKGNSEPQSSVIKITSNSSTVFSIKEKFSGANLSINEPTPGNIISVNLVDILSVTPLNAEEQKKKQTFDVKFKLSNGADPAKIANLQLTMDVAMDNNTVETDQKSTSPAAGVVTMKVKSPGSPVTATVTATGENTFVEIAQADVSFLIKDIIDKNTIKN